MLVVETLKALKLLREEDPNEIPPESVFCGEIDKKLQWIRLVAPNVRGIRVEGYTTTPKRVIYVKNVIAMGAAILEVPLKIRKTKKGAYLITFRGIRQITFPYKGWSKTLQYFKEILRLLGIPRNKNDRYVDIVVTPTHINVFHPELTGNHIQIYL